MTLILSILIVVRCIPLFVSIIDTIQDWIEDLCKITTEEVVQYAMSFPKVCNDILEFIKMHRSGKTSMQIEHAGKSSDFSILIADLFKYHLEMDL